MVSCYIRNELAELRWEKKNIFYIMIELSLFELKYPIATVITSNYSWCNIFIGRQKYDIEKNYNAYCLLTLLFQSALQQDRRAGQPSRKLSLFYKFPYSIKDTYIFPQVEKVVFSIGTIQPSQILQGNNKSCLISHLDWSFLNNRSFKPRYSIPDYLK